MQILPLDAIAPLLDGHVDLRRRPGSLQPLRIPAAEAPLYDPFNRWVASAAAGVSSKAAAPRRKHPNTRWRRRNRFTIPAPHKGARSAALVPPPSPPPLLPAA